MLILDDIQAFAPEELSLWQNLSGQTKNRLENVLLISLYRTENLEPPPPSTNIPSLLTLRITKLDEKGVEGFVNSCFGRDQSIANSAYLVSFLFSMTNGNPFFLRCTSECLAVLQVV